MIGLYDWHPNWGTKTEPELGPSQRLYVHRRTAPSRPVEAAGGSRRLLRQRSARHRHPGQRPRSRNFPEGRTRRTIPPATGRKTALRGRRDDQDSRHLYRGRRRRTRPHQDQRRRLGRRRRPRPAARRRPAAPQPLSRQLRPLRQKPRLQPGTRLQKARSRPVGRERQPPGVLAARRPSRPRRLGRRRQIRARRRSRPGPHLVLETGALRHKRHR